MASNNIKGITIEINGETTALGKALTDVNKKAYNIQKELGEVEKALKFDPKNTELLAQKQQLLGEAVANTAEKLEKLESVQSEVNQQFKDGKISPEQYRAFNRELEKSKSQLEDLKGKTSSVNAIGEAFGRVKGQVADVTAKLAPLIAELQKAGEVAGKIGAGGIKTVGKAVEIAGQGLKIYTGAALAAGTAAGGLAIKAAGSADDLNTLAAQTGLSTNSLQKFQYATDVIDVSMDTLTGSLSKLTKNMAGAKDGTGPAADSFKALGVKVTDSSGALRDNEDVMNDTINALGKVANETERDALAMSIFGKSAQDLNPLILGGADTLKQLGDEAEATGMILSQDALDAANEFGDSLDILKSKASSSGNIIGGVFAGQLKGTVDTISGMIPNVTGAITKLFSGGDISGAQNQLTDTLVSGMGTIVKDFAARLPQFLAGFNAVIISIVEGIISVLPTVIQDILPALLTGFTDLISALIPLLPVLIPMLVDGAITLFMGLLDGLNLVVPQLMAMMPEIIGKLSDMLIQNLPLIISSGIQLLLSLVTGIAGAVPQLIAAVVALIPTITGALIANLPALITAGIQLIIAVATGLPKAIPALLGAIPQIISAIIGAIMKTNWLSVGGDIIKGIANGLLAGIKNINFKSIGTGILKGVKGFLGIHSPSTLFRDEVGTNLALGIGEGFESEMSSVTSAMQKALPTNFDTNLAVNGAANAINQGAFNAQNQTMNLDGTLNINITGEGANRLNDPRFVDQVKSVILNTITQGNRSIPNRTSLIPIG